MAGLICLNAPAAHAAAGALDLSFGTNGMAMPAITGASSISVQAVATQSDGKIVGLGQYVHSGSGDQDFVLFRLLPDGTLDTSFGSGGWVITDFGACDWPKDVAIQLDGKIVAVGVMEPGCGQDSDYQGIVARYLTTGSLDNTFNSDGIHIMSDSWETGWNAVAIDWLDTVVVAGFWGFDICVGHFTIGGEPDNSYGTDGLAFLAPDPSYRSLAADVAIDGSGKAVVVGTVYNTGDDTNAVVARFTTGGVLDNTFNSDGYWAMDLKSSSDDYAAGVVVDSQGRVYMGCHASGGGYGSDRTAVLVRLTTSGALDYNFNGTGKSSNPVTGENMYACGVALDPWEQPLMAGYFGSSTGPYADDSWLIRFLDNGEPDFNFGGDGLQVVRNAPGNCNIYSRVHPVSGGRALCAGSSEGNPIVTRHRLFALDVGGCLERLLWP